MTKFETFQKRLRDREWGAIWGSVAELPLFLAAEAISALAASGWQPDRPNDVAILRCAAPAANLVCRALVSRGGLLVPERTVAEHDATCLLPAATATGVRIGVRPCRPAPSAASVTAYTMTGVAGGASGATLRRWDLRSGVPTFAETVPDFSYAKMPGDQHWPFPFLSWGAAVADECTALMPTADGRLVVAAFGRAGIAVWSSEDLRRIITPPLAGWKSQCLSPDSRTLFTADNGRLLGRGVLGKSHFAPRFWAYETLSWAHRELEPTSERGEVWSMAVSPCGRLLASGLGLGDGSIVVHDSVAGLSIRTLRGHTDSVRQVAFSPNGRFLASASYDGTVALWDTNTWERCAVTQAPPRPTRRYAQFAVAFSGDSQSLVAADLLTGLTKRRNDFFSLMLLDVPSLRPKAHLPHCASKPDHFVFSRSGKAVVAGAIEGRGRVCVWSAADGILLRVFDDAYNASFTPDGKRLLVGGFNERGGFFHIVRTDFLDLALCPVPQIGAVAHCEIMPGPDPQPELGELLWRLSRVLLGA